MTDSLLPPRKKDWKPGTFQVGVFLRTEEGGVVEAVSDTATPSMVATAEDLFRKMAFNDPEKLIDEEAELLLKRLSKHYKQPVMPVGRYCKALWTWMDCVVKAYKEDGGKPSSKFSGLAPVMEGMRIAIQKSNLLWRLIYDGQPLRTKMCPEHKGHWSGLETPYNDCEHGCELTGWIPDDFVPPDPKGPCPHKWRVPRQEDRSLRCFKCDEKVGDY